MSIYAQTITQFSKMIGQAEKWLDAAEAFAQTKNFDANTLLQARLAADMHPLVRQYQSICDGPKFAAARFTGKEAPKHPDNETTIAELRTRMHAVREYLASFKESDFDGADDKVITLPFLPPGKGIGGRDYLVQMVLPNVYFHLTTAYAILRHNGVNIGKMDFIGEIALKDV